AFAGIVLCASICASNANADFIAPTAMLYGWDRPTSAGGTATFQAWETFSSAAGPNGPETVFGAGTGDPSTITTTPPVGNFNRGFGGSSSATWNSINAFGTANIFDTTAATDGEIITSGGNIYSPTGVINPQIDIANAGGKTTGTTTILLQLRTQAS